MAHDLPDTQRRLLLGGTVASGLAAALGPAAARADEAPGAPVDANPNNTT